MDIPKESTQYIAWVKRLSDDKLIELELELSRRITNIKLQLDDTSYEGHDDAWHKRARMALAFDEWRLEACKRLAQRAHVVGAFETKFVAAAKELLDPDTFSVLARRATENGAH